MAELIQREDSLNTGREKINEAIKASDRAESNSDYAVETANEALSNSENTQTQLDTIVIDGDSSVEAAQARVKADGTTFETLRERLNNSDEQLDEVKNDLENRVINVLTLGVKGDGSDDTQAIRDAINLRKPIFFPRGQYVITDEIVWGDVNLVTFEGGNLWNDNLQRNVTFIYDGELAPDKAMFRFSKSPVGIEPTSALSNVKTMGGCLLDGNNKIGYGVYAAFLTNESDIGDFTVTRTLVDGIRIEKSWYTKYRNLTARANQGKGITIGKYGWGGVNGCLIDNLRAWGNGQDELFSDSNLEEGYGVGLFLGSGTKVRNVVSEQNYGAGLYYEMGTNDTQNIDTVYLEGNGITPREQNKVDKSWALIVKGSPTGNAKSIENVFLAGSGSDNEQCIRLIGEGNARLIFSNVGGGGLLQADWGSYCLLNLTSGNIRTRIRGHFPEKVDGVINSTWTTIYVKNDGNDDNNGRTPETAFKTLAKAIEIAKAINTIRTIEVSGNLVHETLDFRGLDREITIDGKGTASLSGTSNNNNGLQISDAENVVNIINFSKISRLILNRCSKVKTSNISYGHIDGSFSGTMEITDSNLLISNCTLSGSQATNQTKNGIRAYNSVITIKESTITGYTQNNTINISDGSRIHADIYIPAFYYTNWMDDTGYVQGGDRMTNPVGTLTFS